MERRYPRLNTKFLRGIERAFVRKQKGLRYAARGSGLFRITTGMEEYDDPERLGWIRVYLETSLAGGAAVDLVVWSDRCIDLDVRSLKRRQFDGVYYTIRRKLIGVPPEALVAAFKDTANSLVSLSQGRDGVLEEMRLTWERVLLSGDEPD